MLSSETLKKTRSKNLMGTGGGRFARLSLRRSCPVFSGSRIFSGLALSGSKPLVKISSVFGPLVSIKTFVEIFLKKCLYQ
jgi:hypothetical protein